MALENVRFPIMKCSNLISVGYLRCQTLHAHEGKFFLMRNYFMIAAELKLVANTAQ